MGRAEKIKDESRVIARESAPKPVAETTSDVKNKKKVRTIVKSRQPQKDVVSQETTLKEVTVSEDKSSETILKTRTDSRTGAVVSRIKNI